MPHVKTVIKGLFFKRINREIIISLALYVGFMVPAFSQQVTEIQLKSAFIYNFLQYVKWENEADISELVIGIYGDNKAMYEELSTTITGARIRNKRIRISKVNNLSQAGNVHILVIPESHNSQVENISLAVRRTNTLLVTDRSAQRKSIMINFVYLSDNRISFEVNRSNIVYERLKLSSEILLLGGSELDIAELYKEMESSLFEMNSRFGDQEATISQQVSQIKTQELEIQTNRTELQRFQQQVSELNVELAQYDRDIVLREGTIQNLQTHQGDISKSLKEKQQELDLALDTLQRRQLELEQGETQIFNLRDEISVNTKILEAQEENIHIQSKTMQRLDTTVDTQRGFLLFMTLGLFLVGVLTLGIYRGNRKLKELGRILEKKNTELQEHERIANTTLENMGQAILMVDGEGKILIYNNQLLKYFKLDRKDLDNTPSIKNLLLLGKKVGDEATLEHGCLSAQKGIQTTYDITTTDDVILEVRQKPLNAGGIVRTWTDVTVIREAEKQLILAKQEAELATIAKASFLATMSHEIRTPMSGVISMADLLQQTELKADQEQMLQTITDSGQSLLTIIDDILDFSKIEAGKLEMESIPLSLTDVVEGSTQTLTGNAIRKGIRLITYVDPELPQFVIGDPVRVRQILINLCGNAIKFSKEGDVVIRVERVKNNEESKVTIKFSVLDQGVGVSEEDQGKLFQAFSQAESSTARKFGGTGLGLTICKMLTELMGGEIGVKSQLGEGSEFYVKLSFNHSEIKVQEDKAHQLDGLRILLLSRHPTEKAILTSYLAYSHAEVTSSDELDTCLEQCTNAKDEGKPFEIVIIGPQWSREEQIKICRMVTTQSTLSDTKFLCLLENPANQEQLELPNTVFMDVDPLRREPFLFAVTSAVGRASPNAHYEEDVEDLRATVQLPTIEEALAQGTLILVAEDNPTNRKVIGLQLNLLGYAYEMANDGRQALDAWRRKQYALLLTDCHMPDMDGFELTDMIRKAEKGTRKRAPIIAITANVLQGAAGRCFAAGMDDFVSKPTNLKELRRVLRKWVPHRETSRPVDSEQLQEQTELRVNTVSKGDYPVDERVLKDMFGDDNELFREILRDFVVPSWEIVEEIKSAIDRQSAEGVNQAAHKLKASARSIGANALANLCTVLESAGGEDDWNTIGSYGSNIDKLMSEVENFISDL